MRIKSKVPPTRSVLVVNKKKEQCLFGKRPQRDIETLVLPDYDITEDDAKKGESDNEFPAKGVLLLPYFV